MKKIIIKQLSLRNFKGIKDLVISFIGHITKIFGDNGTGKSSIFDAFTWLLFDRDSQNRTDFDIKTLDASGEAIHGLEHEAIGILNVDGKDIKLQKTYKEKWTKKRGEAEKEFTGHETLYYIDDVPVKKSEYQDKVNSLIDENIFKLITNPLFFSTNMKWQERRKVLLDIIGDIDDSRVINYKSSLRALESLLVDKDIDTLKKSISARKRKLNDDIRAIPYRIDELNNSIQNLDFEELDLQRRGIIGGLKDLEERMLDRSKANEGLLKEKDKLYQLKSQLQDMEHKAMQEANKPLKQMEEDLRNYENKLSSLKHEIKLKESEIDSIKNEIQTHEKYKETLRAKWYEENNKQFEFDESNCICPTCKRAFDTEDVEKTRQTMLENFNKTKAEKLYSITESGKTRSGFIEQLKEKLEEIDISTLRAECSSLGSKIEELKGRCSSFTPLLNLESNPEYKATKIAIEALEAKLQQPPQSISDVMDLKQKKQELENELQEVTKKINLKEQNEKFRSRIQELMEEERTLAQQIADIEKQEYLCEEFIKTKVELLESSINHKFKYVNFKLFNTLTNGGIEECCEALINGVPFSSANKASQYNAGVDIINALSDYYQVSAPIFFDNRESVNELIHTEAQVVNLIVSKDKTLKVESEVK